MTAPSRKASLYVAGIVGAAVAGFFSHFAVPAAPAAQESMLEKRLLAVELKLETMGRLIEDTNKGMIQVRCRLNIENSCPPEAK